MLALALLTTNGLIAWRSGHWQIQIGASILFFQWLLSICFVLLLRDYDPYFIWFLVHLISCVAFYRAAERDPKSGIRHDWAALIAILMFSLMLIDLNRVIIGNSVVNIYIGISNVIFFFSILLSAAPSIGIILVNRAILMHSRDDHFRST